MDKKTRRYVLRPFAVVKLMLKLNNNRYYLLTVVICVWPAMLQVWPMMRQKCWLFFPLLSIWGPPSTARDVYSMKWFFYFWSPNKKICRNDESEISAAAAAAKCHCLWEQLEQPLPLLPWGELWPELSHSLHLGGDIKREQRLTVSRANCEALLLGGWHFLVAKSPSIDRCHLSALQSTHTFNGDY